MSQTGKLKKRGGRKEFQNRPSHRWSIGRSNGALRFFEEFSARGEIQPARVAAIVKANSLDTEDYQFFFFFNMFVV